MKFINTLIILTIYFFALKAQGHPEVASLEPTIEIDGIVAEVGIQNPFDETIVCSGTIYTETYFDESPYHPFYEVVLEPGETQTFILSSRYGDPLETVWTVIHCGPFNFLPKVNSTLKNLKK